MCSRASIRRASTSGRSRSPARRSFPMISCGGCIPRFRTNGQLVIFNRSHYEDIIAVRVKKLFPGRGLEAPPAACGRVRAHAGRGGHHHRENLPAHLQGRAEEASRGPPGNPVKHWKFNPDDLADRARWDDFMVAYEDVISKTSTEFAPWLSCRRTASGIATSASPASCSIP
jgi:hypothetical protein